MSNLYILKEILLELFFPSKCVFCGVYLEGYICPKCINKLNFARNFCIFCGVPLTSLENICYNCKKEERIIDGLELLGYYKERWEILIQKFKFENKPYLAKTFAYLGKEKIKKRDWHIDFITYVPMERRKELKRGFNQAEILARFLGRELNIKVINILIQKKPILEQKSLEYKERIKNVKDAYKMNSGINIEGRNILLVDDVYTTGATLKECAKELKKGKASKVFSFVICKTLI
ncbi:MAG: ComF family protein [Dictyoglomus sp.]|nr:ComF family protein [Dictyoglomus sp.]MDW8189027.1 ComF family protein [Dictyoglomus sp.]